MQNMMGMSGANMNNNLNDGNADMNKDVVHHVNDGEGIGRDPVHARVSFR